MDKASLFNEYFHSVFTTSNFELPPACDRPEPVSCLSDLIITTTELYQGLSSLDLGKAMECDGIGPKLLKHCALTLHEPFHHLFSLSFSLCYIPAEWRTHLICPIYKSGDKTDVKKYRPISLLCIISKVLERIVYHSVR